MTLITIPASTALVLVLTTPAAAVAINTEIPCCAGIGWQAYQGAGAHPFAPRSLAPRLAIDETNWSSGEGERVAPHK